MVLPLLAPLLPYATLLLPFVLSNATHYLQSSNNHAHEMEKIKAIKELEKEKAKQEKKRLKSRKIAIEAAMETNEHNEEFMKALINEYDQISSLLEEPDE